MDTPITAKAAILQALIEGESYGLELIDLIAKRTKGKIKLGQGSVYPALSELIRSPLAGRCLRRAGRDSLI